MTSAHWSLKYKHDTALFVWRHFNQRMQKVQMMAWQRCRAGEKRLSGYDVVAKGGKRQELWAEERKWCGMRLASKTRPKQEQIQVELYIHWHYKRAGKHRPYPCIVSYSIVSFYIIKLKENISIFLLCFRHNMEHEAWPAKLDGEVTFYERYLENSLIFSWFFN